MIYVEFSAFNDAVTRLWWTADDYSLVSVGYTHIVRSCFCSTDTAAALLSPPTTTFGTWLPRIEFPSVICGLGLYISHTRQTQSAEMSTLQDSVTGLDIPREPSRRKRVHCVQDDHRTSSWLAELSSETVWISTAKRNNTLTELRTYWSVDSYVILQELI